MNKKITCRVLADDGNVTKKEIETDKLDFRVSVYGVVFKNDQVLLSPQWDGYDWPGGGIKKGETIEQALQREFREETGLIVKPSKIITAETDFFVAPFEKKAFHSVLLYYLVELQGGKISTQYFDQYEKEYAKQAEWIDAKKVPNLKFCNPVDNARLIKLAQKLKV